MHLSVVGQFKLTHYPLVDLSVSHIIRSPLMSWKWFGARTFYRMTATGRAKMKNLHFDTNSSIVEERIVLIRAQSAKQAVRKGRKEAKSYSSYSSKNVYGQRVGIRFLGVCECFEMWDQPA